MGVTMHWNGMNEFREQLRNLPEHLANEAADVVEAAAQGAALAVRTNYPTGPTGNLKARVTVSRDRSAVGARSVVASRAPHAWIFENYTGRTRTTDRGYNRGIMREAPEGQKSIPVFIRARARMRQQLIAIIERNGFTVDR